MPQLTKQKLTPRGHASAAQSMPIWLLWFAKLLFFLAQKWILFSFNHASLSIHPPSSSMHQQSHFVNYLDQFQTQQAAHSV
jgi:hypothetical protein